MPAIHETAEAVEALGRKALAVRCDVRKEESVEETVAKTIETFGRIDIQSVKNVTKTCSRFACTALNDRKARKTIRNSLNTKSPGIGRPKK